MENLHDNLPQLPDNNNGDQGGPEKYVSLCIMRSLPKIKKWNIF